MTLNDYVAVFDTEKPHHPEWTASSFGLMLSPTLMALLELYIRHPQSRRSAMLLPFSTPPPQTQPLRMRPPDVRRRPVTPFRGLDQKQLASGEKPDDD